jgi:hypothetical protein
MEVTMTYTCTDCQATIKLTKAEAKRVVCHVCESGEWLLFAELPATSRTGVERRVAS